VAASIHLKAVAAGIHLAEAAVEATLVAAWLWETLSMTSLVVDPYKNPVT
jgi:hypothetical protein